MAKTHHSAKLNQLFATAICGNDILSSVLYVSGIAILFAGIYAPIVLLIVVGILYLYKFVYTEVVEALPVNGGAYNCLLNATSKKFAAVAGVMTILSYTATAVISAKVGVEYLHTIFPVPVILGTILLLLFFALLVISGIKDSAKVAFAIFCIHIISLIGFIILGALYYFSGHQSYFNINNLHTVSLITKQGGIAITLYLAFSASLLGVSGFESSANFVEEQQKGVFRKTLRNMLIGVLVFNPIIALIILNSLPYEAIAGAKDFLLAEGASVIGGAFFKYVIVIDAFFVLSGAVLTSYIGVSGLINRMALDDTLPLFLARPNKRGICPRIIISFFLLCSSILLLTRGNFLSLAGVYTISFLGVMSLFAFGNLILKRTRKTLKRTYHAPVLMVVCAFLATFLGIFGNIRIDTQNFVFFEIYFIPAIFVVFIVINQEYFLRLILKFTKKIPPVHRRILAYFRSLTQGTVVVFIHNCNRLQLILDYIKRNESSRALLLVVCASDKKTFNDEYEKIKDALPHLEKAGFYEKFTIDLMYIDKPFGTAVIDEVSSRYNVRKNKIFIGSIHRSHRFDYGDLGGVRVIF
ncbi:MAG: hypothetical protein A2249_02125 [Candidatus Jacksonbacteria bacterium RIFOXYA2_FULL_44_7]|uniref:Amino acid permease n=1 Tax=Candidatus Jacksonbacteria bacterium RIFCSPLOWO2_02_FULL_44_20 TaxID=1798460 RepID=A0A1G2AC69_9BACT|nr:MAG: Amino acid permease [Parcubacteria group bacterium GW2011_GWC2_44_17]KKT49047.1 MAG: Amino acid permease [Parcubacteria group bacterium GW2011_GWF2_44_17]OGY69761.1 MAG: hypothetical protein A3C00_04600 [Candidatus Jacksonbacteria bacterium RIFCSPHIGHO2_02_FULL_44_25]OGY73640.1 MAG: hypothetical protein A3H61_00415 [Candidatus Jacksonbacteria bacterium RIFCSPLOWO2_02_FULL_44_20]OGY74988.1 MAG: hypothetical protein A3H07_05340 [Candidatus Jacksonbacteria bacterium RIFCSPLOWO2_12_FULL_44_